MKLKEVSKAIAITLAFGAAVWIIDASIYSVFFRKNAFWDALLYDIPAHALYLRTILFVSFMIFAVAITMHITKRKRVEEALRESEEKYRKLLETANEAIFLADAETGIILEANKKAEDLLGMSPDSIRGMHQSELHPKEDAENYMNIFRENLINGKTTARNLLIINKSGEKKLVDISASITEVSGKKIVQEFFRDVTERRTRHKELYEAREKLEERVKNRTKELLKANEKLKNEMEERKRVENALIESELRYRSLFENSPISLWEKDFSGIKEYIDNLRDSGINDFRSYFRCHPDAVSHCAGLLKIVDINRTAVNIYKIENKDKFFNNTDKILCPEADALFFEELIAVAEGNCKLESEGISRTSDGQKNRILIKWAVLPEYQKTLSRVFVSAIDITDKYRSKTALKESEARYRATFSDAAIGIANISTDGEFININKKLTEIFGYTESEILNSTIYELAHPDDLHDCQAQFNNIISGLAEKISFESRFINKKGETVWAGTTTTPLLDSSGNILFLISLIDDISEKKKIEDESRLIQAKLIHANKMTSLGTLVSGVAHEINNPNSFIMSNAQLFSDIWRDACKLLLEHYRNNGDFSLGGLPFSEIDGLVPTLLQGINDGTVRIKNIVDNLRNFARPDGKNINETVDVNSVVRNARAILDAQLRRCTDIFIENYGHNIPSVKGSFQQIEQIVINLIINSLQSLPDKKSGIWVSTYYNAHEGFVIIRVRDEGTGMSEEVLERITEPFFTTKLHEGGTGLGLSISYAIAKEHRGHLEFTSKAGKGTTAFVKLPAMFRE